MPASRRCTSTALRARPSRRWWRSRTCHRASCDSTSTPRPRCWWPRSITWPREFEERVLVPVDAAEGHTGAGAASCSSSCTSIADIASPRKVSVWYSFWGEASSRQEYLDICGKKDEDFAVLVRELIERLIAASRRSAPGCRRRGARADRRARGPVAGDRLPERGRHRPSRGRQSLAGVSAFGVSRASSPPPAATPQRRGGDGGRRLSCRRGRMRTRVARRRARATVSPGVAGPGARSRTARGGRLPERGPGRRARARRARRARAPARLSQHLPHAAPMRW